jgi:pimeloyl-ACP methyl ester carboxylesterase
MFHLWSRFLGDQWSIGDWDGVVAAGPEIVPPRMRGIFNPPPEPPQNLREYDPEWGRAFWEGTVAASCDHERMLRSVRVPVLLTHHFRRVDDDSGLLMGALSDVQARRVIELLTESGAEVDYRSFETTGHSMHGENPELFVDTLVEWASSHRS